MKIGQVEKITQLSAHTIRYYEKLGLINTAAKDNSGHRDYTTKDVELINWVNCLKKSGMPLSKIKLFVTLSHKNEATISLEILEEHLEKLESQLKDIHHYIAVTQSKIKNLKSA